MNVLVIGGAGYIGSHVVRALLDGGHSVTVYDNLSSGLRNNLFPDALFCEGDILDLDMLMQCVEVDRYDAVVHLAAFKAPGESMINPEKYSVNNITGTINILNAASWAKVRLLVFSSSAAVYGEPDYLPIDELHPTRPENYYGFTKLEIERFLDWYSKLRGLRYAALRYFNAAGYDPDGRLSGLERNPGNLLPRVMEVAMGWKSELQIFGDDYDTPDGTCIRDYIHVTDLAAAHIQALEYVGRTGDNLTVNLGSETGLSVKEMVDTARRLTGQPIPAVVTGRRPGDPAKLVASARKARDVLGWHPRFSGVEPLIASSWEAYRKNKR